MKPGIQVLKTVLPSAVKTLPLVVERVVQSVSSGSLTGTTFSQFGRGTPPLPGGSPYPDVQAYNEELEGRKRTNPSPISYDGRFPNCS